MPVLDGRLVFSFKPIEGIIEDRKHFKEDVALSDLDSSHELYSKDNERIIVKMELETAPGLDLAEAEFFRSKSYSINL